MYLYLKGIYDDDDDYYYGGGYGGPWYSAIVALIDFLHLHMNGSCQYSMSYFIDKATGNMGIMLLSSWLDSGSLYFVGRLAPNVKELVQREMNTTLTSNGMAI